MMKNRLRPIHPGEILLEEFMRLSTPPINANMLAKAIDVPANRITAIIKGQRGITGDTAARLATLFDTTSRILDECTEDLLTESRARATVVSWQVETRRAVNGLQKGWSKRRREFSRQLISDKCLRAVSTCSIPTSA